MRITTIQKRELADILDNVGLNGLDFESSSSQDREFTIKYKHNYFSFRIRKEQQHDTYFLTIFPIDNAKGYSVGSSWENTKVRFQLWTKQVAEDINTQTGWEIQNNGFLNAEYRELESSFNEDEKIMVRESIKELQEQIKSIELPVETFQVIERKLDELSLKMDELKKFDWKALFIGTIGSLIMTFTIPPEASGLLWEYVKNAFGRLKLKV